MVVEANQSLKLTVKMLAHFHASLALRSTYQKLRMGKTKSKQVLVQLCEYSLSSALACALSFLEKVSFNKKDGQHLTVICLFARIVELAASCKALLEKEALVGLPILLRSMFEADVDLTNCIKDSNYFKNMYAAFLKEKIRLTKEALPDKDNPYLSPISQSFSERFVTSPVTLTPALLNNRSNFL